MPLLHCPRSTGPACHLQREQSTLEKEHSGTLGPALPLLVLVLSVKASDQLLWASVSSVIRLCGVSVGTRQDDIQEIPFSVPVKLSPFTSSLSCEPLSLQRT